MKPDSFVLYYLSKFKPKSPIVVNRFSGVEILIKDNDDYLTADLIESVLPKNHLKLKHTGYINKDYLLKNNRSLKFIRKYKSVLFFSISDDMSNFVLKGRVWSHLWITPMETVLVTTADEKYLLKRIKRLLKLKAFS